MIRLMMMLATAVGLGALVVRFLPSAEGDVAAHTREAAPAGACEQAPHAVPGARGPMDNSSSSRPATYRITIIANEVDAYGRAWDGVGGGGAAIGPGLLLPLPISSPPDLALCVVGGEVMECHHRADGGMPESLCPDAFRCSWTVTVPVGVPFGLVVYDIDWAAPNVPDANDLVDALVVAKGNQCTRDVEYTVRQAVGLIARTRIAMPSWMPRIEGVTSGTSLSLNPGEERRRSAALTVLDPDGCATSACTLTQSSILIETVP